MLEDAARIQVEDAAQKKRRHERERRRGPHPEIPLYVPEDAQAALSLFRIVPYDRPQSFGHVEVCWRDAGHILGSAMLDVTVRENGRTTRIVFSGDIGQWQRPLMHDPTAFAEADYVIMESTYGDRDHESEPETRDRLAEIINDTVRRGGNILIPTFAIDRAQEIMLHLSELVRQDRIPRMTIFLDSPMAIDATTVYKRYASLLDEETRAMLEEGRHPFQFPGLNFVRNSEESRAINSVRGSCIVLAGSGMCTGGRIKHHLRHNIDRPESTVLFVGYQAHETLGRQILEGREQVRIHGRQFPVKARIDRLYGLSAHADRSGLLRWVSGFESPPRRLFLTHGEESAMTALAEAIRAEQGWNVHAPEYGEAVKLD